MTGPAGHVGEAGPSHALPEFLHFSDDAPVTAVELHQLNRVPLPA